jgi:hypothetical protein
MSHFLWCWLGGLLARKGSGSDSNRVRLGDRRSRRRERVGWCRWNLRRLASRAGPEGKNLAKERLAAGRMSLVSERALAVGQKLKLEIAG